MKVARKHIVAALENPGKKFLFPKYSIKSYPYHGYNGIFGWKIDVTPKK